MKQEEYEAKLHKMQRLHSELDQTFLEVNKVVPYDLNSYDVYSPRYVFMLQDASRQVDGMFKLLYYRLQALHAIKGLPITPLTRFKFLSYYEFLNSKGMLEAQKLSLKEDAKKVIVPFRLTDQNTPPWWRAYNDTKHDLPEGETFGKLGHVIYALAAVASLHDIAQKIIHDQVEPLDTLDGTKWRDNEEAFMTAYDRTKYKSYLDVIVDHTGLRKDLKHKSSLFYYLSENNY